MCIAFICIVTYSLMKSTPLTNLSFLKHIYFASEILLIIGLLINSVPDCKTKNTKNMCFDLVLIAFVTSFFILGYAVNLIFFEGKNIYLILESSFILTLITTPILKVLKDMKIKVKEIIDKIKDVKFN